MGTTSSMIIVDIQQKTCILNVLPVDLCNSSSGRLASNVNTPLSPKLRLQSGSSTEQECAKINDVTDGGNHRILDQVSFGIRMFNFYVKTLQLDNTHL